MQYLRMLTNSIVGGALVAAYVTLLVLLLNPSVDLRSFDAIPLILTWGIFYGLHAAALFYALIVVRQILAVEVRSLGWLSFRLIAWLATLAVSFASIIVWLNLRGFQPVLAPDAARRMTAAAAVLSLSAVLSGSLAILQLSLRRRRGIAAGVLTIVIGASVVVPLVLRGPGSQPPPRMAVSDFSPGILPTPTQGRVTLVLLDGASLDFVSPIAAEGRLPNFGRLLDGGAVMHLATIRPTQPAPVWAAVATGKLPYKNGIQSAARYTVARSTQPLELLPDFCFAQALIRFGLVTQEGHTAAAMRASPLWHLLDGFGMTSGLIGWPLTYPAAPIQGYIVSDEFLQHGDASLLTARDEEPLVFPPGLLDIARTARRRSAPLVLPEARELSNKLGSDPLAVDAAAEELARDLALSYQTRLTAVRYSGLDTAGHYFLRYAVPRAFGDVSAEERRRFGRILEQHYASVDEVLGRTLKSLEPDDLLLVVSGFGMEPLSLGKRLLERVTGDPELSGSHEGAPDGFLIAYGRNVAPGNLSRASIVDVTPTVLYYLGLPIGRDMDGSARTDIFAPAFIAQRPITFIPYYDR